MSNNHKSMTVYCLWCKCEYVREKKSIKIVNRKNKVLSVN